MNQGKLPPCPKCGKDSGRIFPTVTWFYGDLDWAYILCMEKDCGHRTETLTEAEALKEWK